MTPNLWAAESLEAARLFLGPGKIYTTPKQVSLLQPALCFLRYPVLLLLFEFLTSQLSAGKHSPILGFNNEQE